MLPKPIDTQQGQPQISVEQATVGSLSKDVIELQKELVDQRKENKNFIRWIIGGFVAIVAVVAIEIIIFHTRADKDFIDLNTINIFKKLKKSEKNNII